MLNPAEGRSRVELAATNESRARMAERLLRSVLLIRSPLPLGPLRPWPARFTAPVGAGPAQICPRPSVARPWCPLGLHDQEQPTGRLRGQKVPQEVVDKTSTPQKTAVEIRLQEADLQKSIHPLYLALRQTSEA
jgi:hypothetical protein